MKYTWSDTVRKALAIAREIAIRGHHEGVFPEHMATGALDAGGEEVPLVLSALGVDPARLRGGLQDTLSRARMLPDEPHLRASARVSGRRRRKRHGFMAYSMSAKRGLGQTLRLARDLDAPWITCDILLAGALQAHPRIRGLATEAGVDIEALETAIARRLDGTLEPAAAPTPEGGPVFVIDVDPEADEPIYEQIVRQVEEAVATGLLAPGEQLPPVRQMAEELSAAPGTVARAYRTLEERGVVITEGSRGTRVAPRPEEPEDAPEEVAHDLVGLLRPVVVAAYHLGAVADQLRSALEAAMEGILVDPTLE